MKRLIAALLLSIAPIAAMPAVAQPARQEVLDTMKRATRFMVEELATEGGYVWTYLPDRSRRWGELEAKRSMIWVQPPGTATMGHIFMDAYNATGDDYYYQAAEQATRALIWGQHASGGWSYFIDFGGAGSTRDWYETIGENAWRAEEFHQYTGNATFDDAGTAETMQLLLRVYMAKRDPAYRAPLARAIDFVLDSQYPIGGWPQRYPHNPDAPGYQRLITFNDDVAAENVRFLVMAYQALGETRILDAIHRGMNAFVTTQLGAPQPGWALQYTLDLQPAPARTYEPNAVVTHTTATNIRELMSFYRLTGDTRFLARIPDAIVWLEKVRLPAGQERGNRTHPTFLEIGTDRPLYVHREGSNVVNGRYFTRYEPVRPIGHYSPWRPVDTARLRRDYDALRAMPLAEATAGSPLLATERVPLPRYFILSGTAPGSDFTDAVERDLDEVVGGLNERGWWPAAMRETSNRYAGPGPAEVAAGDFSQTYVGDASDTSPYPPATPVTVISTAEYVANMTRLIHAIDEGR